MNRLLNRLNLVQIWWDIRSSYWFVPSLMTLAAAVAAPLMVWLDRRMMAEGLLEEVWWVYQGGADGARTVLSSVAGSVITVAGVVFSITVAALSMASQQLGPRLLRNFMRDAGNQVTFGTFAATFIYCLLVLRTIRGDDGDGGFVPQISVTLGVLLALASIGVLIYFIHHIAMTMQAPNVIGAVSREMMTSIDRLFPEHIGEGESEREAEDERWRRAIPADFVERAATVAARHSGYLEAVDEDDLIRLAAQHDLIIRLVHRPGDFVVEGKPLAKVWPPQRCDDEVGDRVARLFSLGSERTPTQDAEYTVHQLVEVGVRALSPGINDPFTAINAIDHLGAGLCRLAQRRIPSRYRCDPHGHLRVIADAVTFEGIVESALNQFRQNASQHVAVVVRLLEMITTVVECVTLPERREPLLRHAQMIRDEALARFGSEHDRRSIESRFVRVIESLNGQEASLRPGNDVESDASDTQDGAPDRAAAHGAGDSAHAR